MTASFHSSLELEMTAVDIRLKEDCLGWNSITDQLIQRSRLLHMYAPHNDIPLYSPNILEVPPCHTYNPLASQSRRNRFPARSTH
jgi:hypothetical protein